MKVNEIFYSIEGEGIRAGVPCVFIRLFGCNIRCKYCDSLYACEGDDYTEMSIDDILKKVVEYDCPNVTVTGGEPLIHEGINDLLDELDKRCFKVNVETNGTVEPTKEYCHVFYTMDFKTGASGMTKAMNVLAFVALKPTDVIKFVVGSKEDLVQSVKFYQNLGVEAIPFVSPVFGQIEPCEIAEFLKENHLNKWRLQLQIHKFIWDPQKRGV